jgi:hypothetical protein
MIVMHKLFRLLINRIIWLWLLRESVWVHDFCGFGLGFGVWIVLMVRWVWGFELGIYVEEFLGTCPVAKFATADGATMVEKKVTGLESCKVVTFSPDQGYIYVVG